MIAPAWMHEQITAAQYDSWSEEQCAGIEIVADIVSPGSESTDRFVKAGEYARAGITYYWRMEQPAGGVPLVHTHVLDPATRIYRDGDVHAGVVTVSAPFPATIDLSQP
ncbi:hypothetical protein [Parafrankia sp. FMc2]|uniref:hypothetical protein n=1 Tax=Parafrankia sp. FMc2 TaxID=3233196 RepID=UPI0034D74035